MATQPELTAVANALAKALQGDINAMVPSWAQGMIPANEANILGGQLAKIAVDTLDAFRAMEKPGNTVKGNPFETGADS
jgi:hypothetical protein